MTPAPAAVPREKNTVIRVPLVLRQPALKLMNESKLQLDVLSVLIYDHFKQFFFPGELVQLHGAKQDGNIIKGRVIERKANKKNTPPTFSYNIKLLEKNDVITAVPAIALRRVTNAPSVNVLQTFILANAKYGGDSPDNAHWVLNKKLVKPKKNSALKKVLSEHRKNAHALIEKRKLENDSENSKIKLKNTNTLQPVAKKQKLGKLAKSPRSGVPPIWAKLLKSFPLEPEVVLVRLEDGNGVTNGNVANLQNSNSKEKLSTAVCGKENKARISPNKKMKQMTLFDMKKKSVSTSENKSDNCMMTMNAKKDSGPAAIQNATVQDQKTKDATANLVMNTSMKKKDKLGKVQDTKKASIKKLKDAIKNVSKKIAAAESDGLQKSDRSKKTDTAVSHEVSPVGDSLVTKITFSDFTSKIKSNQEMNISVKSALQGTLDGILKKGAAHVVKVIKPLPSPTPVKTPPGFENEWFGDAAMIMQFLSSFRNILQPDKSITLSTAMLMEAVINGSAGFLFLNNIIVCLLRTLVQGCSAEDYQEAGISLAEVPITIYSASELTRLCLQKNANHGDLLVQDMELTSLSNKELHHLEPCEKLKVICRLCSNVLSCYTIDNYVTEIQKTVKKLRMDQFQVLKEKNQIKSMLLEKDISIKNKNVNEQEMLSPEQKLNPGSFYGPLAMNDSILKESNEDELHSGFTTRRLSLQKAKAEKQKAEKLKLEQAKKEREELKKRKDEEDLKRNVEFHVNEVASLKCHKPLGKDRNMSRYWLFPHFTPQLVIEKGWWEEMDADDKTNQDCEPKLSPRKAELDAISHKRANRWFVYETPEDVKALLECLSNEGNEQTLQSTLKKYLSTITTTKENKNNLKDEYKEEPNGDLDLIEAFRDEILDLHCKITEGVLGDLNESEKWFANVDNANTCQDFAKCLLALQNSLYPKFLCGAFRNANPNKRKIDVSKKDISVTTDITENLKIWQDMVKTCQTMSRLHVLLGLFSSCVQWNKSSAKTKCKVCRKNNDDTLLLCDTDDCSNGFHLGCLRPRLRSIPKDDWFCPSCVKAKEESESEESSEEDEEKNETSTSETEDDAIDVMKKKVLCVKCKRKGDERLLCAKCFKGWHPACHIPPMRNIPRGPWFCQRCRCKKGKRSTRRSNK